MGPLYLSPTTFLLLGSASERFSHLLIVPRAGERDFRKWYSWELI